MWCKQLYCRLVHFVLSGDNIVPGESIWYIYPYSSGLFKWPNMAKWRHMNWVFSGSGTDWWRPITSHHCALMRPYRLIMSMLFDLWRCWYPINVPGKYFWVRCIEVNIGMHWQQINPDVETHWHNVYIDISNIAFNCVSHAFGIRNLMQPPFKWNQHRSL